MAKSAVQLSVAELLRPPAQALRRATTGRSGEGSSSTRLGRGLDFAELRAYVPGDESRFIDWRASARRGNVLIKTFHPEEQCPVLVLADCGASMQFASVGALKSIVATRLAAALAWQHWNADDEVAIDTAQPVRDASMAGRVIQSLYQRYVQHSPLPEAQRRDGVVYLISDGSGLEQARDWATQLRGRARLSLVCIEDPLESQPPQRALPVRSLWGRGVLDGASLTQQRTQREALRCELTRQGASWLTVRPDVGIDAATAAVLQLPAGQAHVA